MSTPSRGRPGESRVRASHRRRRAVRRRHRGAGAGPKEVDVLVDLMGHTGGCRAGVLAHRPAPVQVSYLGFPASIGRSIADYIVADEFVIPPERRGSLRASRWCICRIASRPMMTGGPRRPHRPAGRRSVCRPGPSYGVLSTPATRSTRRCSMSGASAAGDSRQRAMGLLRQRRGAAQLAAGGPVSRPESGAHHRGAEGFLWPTSGKDRSRGSLPGHMAVQRRHERPAMRCGREYR